MSGPEQRREPPDLAFRTSAAPGLDEDDVFAALFGLPGQGAFWGDGVPMPPPGDGPWDEERERRRRHQDTLRRWPPTR